MDKRPLLIRGGFFREKGGTEGKPLVPPLCDYEQRVIFFTKEMIGKRSPLAIALSRGL